MSLPWVKLHTSLLDNETFQRFSPAAKLTFLTALMIAGKQDLGGRLEAPPFGAIDSKAIALKTGCRIKMQDDSLSELVAAGFLSVDLNGTYVVERWDEKAGDESRLANQRERSRRAREKRATRDAGVTENGSRHAQNVTDTEKEVEVEYASLRSAAIGYGDWPTETPYLNALALIFLDRFANTRDADAAKKQLGAYTSTLAGMRQRGVTIEQAWSACEEAWKADGEQLWGPKIRRAFDFLPSWREKPDTRRRSRDHDRGDNWQDADGKGVA